MVDFPAPLRQVSRGSETHFLSFTQQLLRSEGLWRALWRPGLPVNMCLGQVGCGDLSRLANGAVPHSTRPWAESGGEGGVWWKGGTNRCSFS